MALEQSPGGADRHDPAAAGGHAAEVRARRRLLGHPLAPVVAVDQPARAHRVALGGRAEGERREPWRARAGNGTARQRRGPERPSHAEQTREPRPLARQRPLPALVRQQLTAVGNRPPAARAGDRGGANRHAGTGERV